MPRMVFCGILFCLLASYAHAQTPAPTVEDREAAVISTLHWRPATSVSLVASKSKIIKLDGYLVVTGDEALRLRVVEDPGNVQPGLEAQVVNPTSYAEAIYAFSPVGYVSSNDWTSVDADALLDQIRKNTDAINPRRIADHFPTMTVTNWVQRPTLNPDTHTVSWMFKLVLSNNTSLLNAVALKLGRFGYERIVFIDDAAHEATATQNLLLVANAHQFDPSARYSDYVTGTDHAAAYGVAGLVAGVMGVKLLQVAAAGGLILLAKKFAFVVCLPFIWLWRTIRSKRKAKYSVIPIQERLPPPS